MTRCERCREEHQRCLDHWDTLSPEVAKGTTFHFEDAHHRPEHEETP